MTNTQEFTLLLRKLQSSNRFEQATAIKALAAYIQEAKRTELEEHLELLISTHDIEIQVKLLSLLAAYLVNNGTYYEVVIKYNPIYDTIQNLLVRGLPLKAAAALNFVVALLCCDDGDQRCLATQARNRIRLSGCLNAMAEMFSSSMMYQDTWVALCQSLAEACSGSEVNQSYCSHLVPLCVHRCQQGNIDVCAVLQSLLHNHDRNVKLFIESEGLAIFTRQALQYSMCMQLLSTVVGRAPEAVSILRNTNVESHLRDFLHLYGPFSQMGQWSTIILFHFNRGASGSTANVTTDMRAPNYVSRNENRTNTAMEIDHTINSQTKDLTAGRNIHVRQRPVFVSEREDTFRVGSVQNPKQNAEDTAKLFRNVIKEVNYWKSREQMNATKVATSTPLNKQSPVLNFPNVIKFQNNSKIQREQYQESPEKELTFSFLIQKSRQFPKKPLEIHRNDKIMNSFLTDADRISLNFTNNFIEHDIQEQSKKNDLFNTINNYNQTVVALKNFNPPFHSTPKRLDKTNHTRISRRSRNSRKVSRNYTRVSKASKQENATMTKQNSILNPTGDIKHTSMSARLFNAINESCTTFVKSVKSIFRPKQHDTYNDKTITRENTYNECSYSFTNYMRKRDALLEEESSDEDSNSDVYKVDSCKTCKDTIILQQKMVKDDNLKLTVKKLKKGINLYGCDFKKISKTFWPRNKYMTPEMLYNLYRKLIVKGGHGDHEFRQKAYNIMRKM